MQTIAWNIQDEWQPLEAVMVGIGNGMGPAPTLEETYDPQSRRHVAQGTYPTEADVTRELEAFVHTLEDRGIRVLRPLPLGFNQVFTRDIGLVIDGTFVMTSMVEDRAQEQAGLKRMLDRHDGPIAEPPAGVRLEGGDIMPMPGEIWVGCASPEDFKTFTTARTNHAAAAWLQELFPHRVVKTFNLTKSDSNPLVNALHLDCCLAPLGMGHILVHREGFENPAKLDSLLANYPADCICAVTAQEMQTMHCNVFSIAPDTVISDVRFTRTNEQMRKWGYRVIEVDLRETSKMGGLLRCSTLPLRRTPIA